MTNPITPRVGSITVTKQVTGLTAGLDPGAPPFSVTLNCGPGRTYELDVPADGSATQNNIPVGSVCTATESEPTGGLVDASYAWDNPPTYVPADATATVCSGTPPTITVINEIVRVTAPVRLVKTVSGTQGVIDPAKHLPHPVVVHLRRRGRGRQRQRVDPRGPERRHRGPLRPAHVGLHRHRGRSRSAVE